MKCPKSGCGGIMRRFTPKHLVTACHRADTGVLLELRERVWKQVGFMCDRCGYLEFYAQDPSQVLQDPAGYFDSTEPER